MTTMTLEQIQVSTTSLPIIGYTVFWRLNGVRVAQADLQLALTEAGLLAYAPEPPTPRTALRRALVAWIHDRAGRGQGPALTTTTDDVEEATPGSGHAQRALIRVVNTRKSVWIVFALVAEEIDLTRLGLSYGTSLRVMLNKTTREIIVTTEAEGAIEAVEEATALTNELRPYWECARDVLVSADLSSMTRDIIGSMQAVSLRREGGLYFVPAQHQVDLEQLRDLVANLPTDGQREPFVVALGVPNAVEARRQLAGAVQAGFEDDLKTMTSDLQRFVAAEPGSVRADTVSQRLVAYRQLKGKAQLYTDLLGMHQERIVRELATLQHQAEALLLDH